MTHSVKDAEEKKPSIANLPSKWRKYVATVCAIGLAGGLIYKRWDWVASIFNSEHKGASLKTTGADSPIFSGNRDVNYTVSRGATKEEVQNVVAEGNAKLLKDMGIIQQMQGSEFTNEFPLGYVLVTLTDKQKPVPLRQPSGGLEVINWDKAAYESTAEMVKIKLPDVLLPGNSVIQDTTVHMPRKTGMTVGLLLSSSKFNQYNLQAGNTYAIGSSAEPGPMHPIRIGMPPFTHALVMKLVKSRTEGSVVLLAVKDLPKDWKDSP